MSADLRRWTEVGVAEEHEALREAVASALRRHDRAKAVRTAVEAVSSGALDVPALYREVLTPLLRETGQAWSSGATRVWEEHLASQAVRSIVELVYPAVLKQKATVAPTGRSVLLACPPEEAHDLGLRMVADRFDMAGWTSYFLGADTPADELVHAARSLDVDAVVLSSSTHFHRVGLRHVVDRLRAEAPGVSVWVGGPAFAHDREGWSDDDLVDLDALLTGAGED
jgi:MerR family transcriptional regulator, light-induced transcriptional regulator